MDVRTRRLLEAPLVPTLARLGAPNIVVMMVETSISLIETYFAAALGNDALAGLALVFPVVMLVQMLSAGGMGGGIQSAVSRALGAGRQEEAGLLAWHATALGLGLGIATSLLALPLGPSLYALMGGTGGSLQAATDYANVVFGGAILIWLFNALSAVIRGTGNMALPAIVTCLALTKSVRRRRWLAWIGMVAGKPPIVERQADPSDRRWRLEPVCDTFRDAR